MLINFQFIGFYTLFLKETTRFASVFMQTIFAPIITSLLYLLIFGAVMNPEINQFENTNYSQFLLPGLIIMTLMQNSFANASSSLIQSKLFGNIDFLLLSPLRSLEIYLAFVTAAALRGILVAIGVYIVGIFLYDLPVYNPAIIVGVAILSCLIMGSIGLIAGIVSSKFDHLAAFQNFIILPLTYLSGVFYSISSLPYFWQQASKLNPFFYLIDLFRFGFFGVADISPIFSFSFAILFLLLTFAVSFILLHKGYKLRK